MGKGESAAGGVGKTTASERKTTRGKKEEWADANPSWTREGEEGEGGRHETNGK